MTRVEKIIWLLGNKLSEQEQNDISDMVQETIQSFKQSDTRQKKKKATVK